MERRGLKPVKSIQINSMDADLRNGLWSAFYVFYYNRWDKLSVDVVARRIMRCLWLDHLKRRVGELFESWLPRVDSLMRYL